MPKHPDYFLTELRPDDFRPDTEVAVAAVLVALDARRIRVASRCSNKKRDSALVWDQIGALDGGDQAHALKSLAYFVQVAQNGPPLTQHLDKKQVHETHEFVSPVSGKTEKVWRYRRGDIRILFYYGPDRVLLVVDVVAKRSDRLEQDVLNRAEQAVNEYLSAIQSNRVVMAEE